MDKRKKQRWFDRAVNGLAGQGFERSIDQDWNRCVYRGPDGKKCAVGHLVRDCDFNPIYERMGVYSAANNGLLILGRHPNGEECAFLSELQACHDNSDTPSKMKLHLKSFAKDHDLEIPRKLYGA